MKNLLLVTFSLCTALNCFSQNKENPLHPFTYYNNIEYANLRIKSVKTTSEYSELVFSYTNTEHIKDGWFNINKNTCLRDSQKGKKYKLKKVKNIPYSPERKSIAFNENCEFTLYFEILNKDCKTFDFIEGDNIGDGFTLENIRLDGNQLEYQRNIDEIQKHIPIGLLLTLRNGRIFKFAELYEYYKTSAEHDPSNFSNFVKITEQDDGSKIKKDIYKFSYNGSNIYLITNSETKDNIQVIVQLKDDFEYTRFWYNLKKIHFLNDNGNGTWSLPDRIFSVVSPIKKNKMVSWLAI
ncbi:hypothetical protein SAMN05216474_0786 [Lishizhenia tianjinensis]|uniref:Uncharacterized protein n=1 Tax=Lishizhenia tianjinensis TaxID=477690 RepID=A0A1I6YBX3_9FLAO|nr:hypothetical protein [Lishizhenia tianjinensis]SFT47867.1 hypothetical protein SAMN05216474_0786 [Lishizhenia tianjinensis]